MKHARPKHPAPSDVDRPLTAADVRCLDNLAPVTWMLVDKDGRLLDISSSGCRLLGKTREAIVGTAFSDWVTSPCRTAAIRHFERCRNATGDTVEVDLQLQTTSGDAIDVRLYSRCTTILGAKVIPTVVIDMSESMSLIRSAEATQARLIARVSHELRNPLSPALIAAASLTTLPDMPDRARDLGAIIRRNIEVEARLIDNLVDTAELTQGDVDFHFASIDLRRVLRRAISECEDMARAKNVTIALDADAGPVGVWGDAGRLQQVFWNLLSNAVTFSRPGSTVTAELRGADPGVAVVSIRDVGRGMDRATLDRLFMPFERRSLRDDHRAGLGLGLAVAHGIVEEHQGRMWASSSGPDEGSTFHVELPRMAGTLPSTAAAGAGSTDQETDAPARGRVLLVEDHEDTGAMLTIFLEGQGYSVTHVRTLAEGLRALNAEWTAVLSDIGLRDGSGLDLGRAARQLERAPAHLVALSGYGTRRDIEASREAGFDHHLVKPVNLGRLLQLLNGSA